MGGHKGEKRGLRIDSSTVGMESARSYRASQTTITRFSMRQYQGNLAQDNNALNTEIGNDGDGTGEAKQSSQKAATSMGDWQNRFQISAGRLSIRSSPSQTLATIRNHTVNYILDLFFGYRRNVWNPWSNKDSYSNQLQPVELQPVKIQEWNISQESYYYESEETFFSTQGTVRTGDGREINFNVNVGMSREFQQYYQEEFQMSQLQLTDPLVINLDGDVADISDQTFYFDIDGDGTLDEINQLGSRSGFLALDKNGDGIINDGTELFGTSSGNGFRDLAQYDDDGDGWIDEDDAIWSKLRIWCKDENGNDVLYKLSDVGVGAICLQNVGTEFSQQGQDGSVNAVVRNTGVFLYENGNVGTVQHVDMVQHSYSA